jgi:hypothetical protein
MTSQNKITQSEANPLDPDSTDPVSAIANTPNHASKHPAWFHDLIRHLRQYRPWRFLIRSDNTIDLQYLTALAVQAQQRARRPRSPALQLSLFPIRPDEVTLLRVDPVHTEKPAMPSFSLITGANRRDNQNTITLPDHILTIRPGEQLHEYLRRVADAAVAATIAASGSPQAALTRLGSKAHTITPVRPTLSLAPTSTSFKTRDPAARP